MVMELCYLRFIAISSEFFSAYCKSLCHEFRILLQENGTCIDVISVKLSIFNFKALGVKNEDAVYLSKQGLL